MKTPLLADTKIIAEAWDAAGAYQVGTFGDDRWAEWNGRYRDDVRRYWKNDSWQRGSLATRLAGSSDLYQAEGRPPYCSINFVTSHDGFTLSDLVSYNEKHNLENGEDNRDGDNHNFSDNHGEEGPSDNPQIQQVRTQQVKNLLVTLLVSQGVPMLVSGDECRRTQRGNNNAYCQDNEISWLDWRLIEEHQDLVRFVRALIEFRRNQPTVRRPWFLSGQRSPNGSFPDVAWYEADGSVVDWQVDNLPMSCLFAAPDQTQDPTQQGRHLWLAMNPTSQDVTFSVPSSVSQRNWTCFVDTAASSPYDIFPEWNGPALESDSLLVKAKAMLVYLSR